VRSASGDPGGEAESLRPSNGAYRQRRPPQGGFLDMKKFKNVPGGKGTLLPPYFAASCMISVTAVSTSCARPESDGSLNIGSSIVGLRVSSTTSWPSA
jgi:hypothetical protein